MPVSCHSETCGAYLVTSVLTHAADFSVQEVLMPVGCEGQVDLTSIKSQSIDVKEKEKPPVINLFTACVVFLCADHIGSSDKSCNWYFCH